MISDWAIQTVRRLVMPISPRNSTSAMAKTIRGQEEGQAEERQEERG